MLKKVAFIGLSQCDVQRCVTIFVCSRPHDAPPSVVISEVAFLGLRVQQYSIAKPCASIHVYYHPRHVVSTLIVNQVYVFSFWRF